MVALDVVGVDEHARHQRVVGDVAVALVEGRERLLHVPSWRIDSTIPVTQPPKCVLDLVRLPALGGAAERVADGGAGEAADGPVGQQVSAHVLILDSRSQPSRPARRPAGWAARSSSPRIASSRR